MSLFEEDSCAPACSKLPKNLRHCVNLSMVASSEQYTCDASDLVEPEQELLIAICVLAGVFIICAFIAYLIKRRMRRKEKKGEKVRLQTFNSTAQFYKFDSNKVSLPNPEADAKRVYPDPQAYDQDEIGEPVAMSGAPLYAKNVVRGNEPPKPAAQQLGGGRLQRLWLARGGAGGGKMTGAAERRLRRLAAMRVNEGEDGAGDDGGAPESAAS